MSKSVVSIFFERRFNVDNKLFRISLVNGSAKLNGGCEQMFFVSLFDFLIVDDEEFIINDLLEFCNSTKTFYFIIMFIKYVYLHLFFYNQCFFYKIDEDVLQKAAAKHGLATRLQKEYLYTI